jgi:DNA-binding response OmpR family regulator
MPKKVLIVDDHPEIRQLIRITLGRVFQVSEAADGESALQLVHEQMPELIILDIGLRGGMDGLQVLDALRSNPATAATKTVLLSARASAADVEDGLRRGADAYLCKPFSPVALVNEIKAMLA